MNENDGTSNCNKTPKKGFHFRMPADMRARIDEARRKSGRSVNEELLVRIQSTLDAEEPTLVASIDRLKASVDELNRRLTQKK